MFKEIKTAEGYLKVLEAVQEKITVIGGKERVATYIGQFRQIVADANKIDDDFRKLCGEFNVDYEEISQSIKSTLPAAKPTKG